DDGGDTWTKLGPRKSTQDEGAKTKDKEEGTKDKEQATKEEKKLGGTPTVPPSSGLPKGPWGRIAVAVAPSDGRRVYALIEAEKGGLYRSDDGGKKWERINGNHYLLIRPWYFCTVTVDPVNPDVVWCPNLRLLKSVDGGKTFKNVKGPHHVDHHHLWI